MTYVTLNISHIWWSISLIVEICADVTPTFTIEYNNHQQSITNDSLQVIHISSLEKIRYYNRVIFKNFMMNSSMLQLGDME
jgi:glycine cleavage system protein P-like pyridoxal-binding family